MKTISEYVAAISAVACCIAVLLSATGKISGSSDYQSNFFFGCAIVLALVAIIGNVVSIYVKQK